MKSILEHINIAAVSLISNLKNLKFYNNHKFIIINRIIIDVGWESFRNIYLPSQQSSELCISNRP